MNSGYEQLKISPFLDHRGQLKKIVQKSMLSGEQEIEEIYVLYSNKNTVRGNHFHQRAIEFFTVLSGEAIMAFSDIDKKNMKIVRMKASDNQIIKVYPNTVHAIKNESEVPLIVLAVSLKEYNPQDTDTFPCNLLD
ncbi:MAG: dTDP-4-dehydrorhamnose 3,5 epimerase [Clostridia bacterium]|jgi:dTDP-4-dehydrorhamnose 3,5-epimerase|nr:dTDP-4-dehydrorhamnose 3,5 epimerase [Clostridia bacterium]